MNDHQHLIAALREAIITEINDDQTHRNPPMGKRHMQRVQAMMNAIDALQPPGVVTDFAALLGTGVGSSAREMTEMEFSHERQ